MIHDILFPLTGGEADDDALAHAIALASDTGSHLTVLQVIDLPVPYIGPMGASPDYLLAELYGELRRSAADEATRLRARLGREDISWELRSSETMLGDAPGALSFQGRHADLAIVAAPQPGQGGKALVFFHALLFESGRPVLVMPATLAEAFPPRHAVVAWRPTREATRALHDALPLLARCRTVDVVCVDPQARPDRDGEAPGAGIAAHLARHGLRVNVVELSSDGAKVADVLLRHCRESCAGLLVAGGYGHARAREWALGGTTRRLLETASVPVLFSH